MVLGIYYWINLFQFLLLENKAFINNLGFLVLLRLYQILFDAFFSIWCTYVLGIILRQWWRKMPYRKKKLIWRHNFWIIYLIWLICTNETLPNINTHSFTFKGIHISIFNNCEAAYLVNYKVYWIFCSISFKLENKAFNMLKGRYIWRRYVFANCVQL